MHNKINASKAKKDLIIVGAGLSGLCTAVLLKDSYNIIVLEARDRLGGRILTSEGHDMGPSWIWPHQKNILELIHALDLTLFSQFTNGDALYDTTPAVQRFIAPPATPSARINGGLGKLIEALSAHLPPEMLRLKHEVKCIAYSGEKLAIKTDSGEFFADYAVSTLPPRLALDNILYDPPLSRQMQQKMQHIPTWMGHAGKCVIEFTYPFWKDENLSGFVFSHLGPLSEIHDACTDEKAALFGFLHPKASSENITEQVETQIRRLFGSKVDLITKIYLTDWRKERFSSSPADHKGLSEHPVYGSDLKHFENKLFFIGTETAFDNGGYLEGAVNSAKELATRLRSVSF